MNTGLHDSVNLAWKLALVLRGVAKPEILETYERERLPNVEKLIKYDKDIARLMSLQLPEGWLGDPRADPNEILGEVMKEAGTFSSGLGIYYELGEGNELSVDGSYDCDFGLEAVRPGKRAPDVKLVKPGTSDPTRLIQQTPNNAGFYIVLFAGDPSKTGTGLKVVEPRLRASRLLNQGNGELHISRLETHVFRIGLTNAGLISWLTIPAATGPSPYELLGMEPFGRLFYDPDGSAHRRYGVPEKNSVAVVVRPDGWIGTIVDLKARECVDELEEYFRRFLNV